ncbi:MAG: molybdenum cofactor biosynthesis protein MoaE, partial [Planctomycetaceae bacterium]
MCPEPAFASRPDAMASPGVALVRRPIDTEGLLRAVARPSAGGNVLFVGTTRGVTDGVGTRSLDYEAHEPLATAALVRLAGEAIARVGLAAGAVATRLRVVAVGETRERLATRAAHRAD